MFKMYIVNKNPERCSMYNLSETRSYVQSRHNCLVQSIIFIMLFTWHKLTSFWWCDPHWKMKCFVGTWVVQRWTCGASSADYVTVQISCIPGISVVPISKILELTDAEAEGSRSISSQHSRSGNSLPKAIETTQTNWMRWKII